MAAEKIKSMVHSIFEQDENSGNDSGEDGSSLPIVYSLPDDAANILVQVSSIRDPGHFYIILPFDMTTLPEINEIGLTYSILNEHAFMAINVVDLYYSHLPDPPEGQDFAVGSLVAAKLDDMWLRARVTNVFNPYGIIKVFFIDLGVERFLPDFRVQPLMELFQHFPHRAMRCALSGVKPVGGEWSFEAVDFFKNLIEGKMLILEAVQRRGDVFHVTLRENNAQTISRALISRGYGVVERSRNRRRRRH